MERADLLWSMLLKRPVSLQSYSDRLKEDHLSDRGLSRHGFYRMIEILRQRHRAEISFVKSGPNRGCWSLNRDDPVAKVHDVFGLYHSTAELFAFLAVYRYLQSLHPLTGESSEDSAVAATIETIENRFKAHPRLSRNLKRRVRILPLGSVPFKTACFHAISRALFGRYRLRMAYRSLQDGHLSERVISPQRLVYYRDNWYLDAWCHEKNALRTFEAGGILSATVLENDIPAKEVSDRDLDEVLTAGYGIFMGSGTKQARLRFFWPASLRVSMMNWHPEQKVETIPDDGSGPFDCILTVRYSNDPELIMDILRFGPQVEVLEPQELREKVKKSLQKARTIYGRVPKKQSP